MSRSARNARVRIRRFLRQRARLAQTLLHLTCTRPQPRNLRCVRRVAVELEEGREGRAASG